MAIIKTLRSLPGYPHNIVTWKTKKGQEYYIVTDRAKHTHNVYRILENGYQKIYCTKDYYSIEKTLERFERDEN